MESVLLVMILRTRILMPQGFLFRKSLEKLHSQRMYERIYDVAISAIFETESEVKL
jgi:hypothetical protein